MSDLSKFTDKLGLQKIINDVKSMIAPAKIPDANKDDPVGFCLAELVKFTQELADGNNKQADVITKISSTLGALHQELNQGNKPTAVATDPKAEVSKAENSK